MTTSLADDSALLSELRALAEQGRHREVLGRLHGLPVEALAGRTAFALLAAEAHGRLGEYSEAQRWAELVLVLARSRGEGQAELRALNYKGAIALRGGDVDEAELRFAEALTVARAVQDHAAEARCLNNLGIIAFLRGDPGSALANYQLARAAGARACRGGLPARAVRGGAPRSVASAGGRGANPGRHLGRHRAAGTGGRGRHPAREHRNAGGRPARSRRGARSPGEPQRRAPGTPAGGRPVQAVGCDTRGRDDCRFGLTLPSPEQRSMRVSRRNIQ